MSYTAAVITISDKGSRGERVDTSGPAVCAMLRDAGYEIVHTAILPDEAAEIRSELVRCADELHVALVLTTGGTGFSPRDITPEATLAVVERATPGIPEAMRYASLRVTPRGCLSRGAAGIRGGTLIVNLPGSERAARENLSAVLDPLAHGLEMLASSGSADCGQPPRDHRHHEARRAPSLDVWMEEAKAAPNAGQVGMYLSHRGVVRRTAKAVVREDAEDSRPVEKLSFSCDRAGAEAAVEAARRMDGIYYVRTWLNEGELAVGDDIMQVLIGGDIRPHVVEALQYLVGRLKNDCVREMEIF